MPRLAGVAKASLTKVLRGDTWPDSLTVSRFEQLACSLIAHKLLSKNDEGKTRYRRPSKPSAANSTRLFKEITNDLRGKIGGWDFKAYVLGPLFYRYLCEHLAYLIDTEQIEACESEDFAYAALTDKEAEEAREFHTDMRSYYILPSQLFDILEKDSKTNFTLNTDLANAFKAVEESTVSADSADDFKTLFQDFDVSSHHLEQHKGTQRTPRGNPVCGQEAETG
ncbi:hypothetical protein CpMB16_07475 [Corynebacterium pseudotuberculosis]|nr:hypothetical protein ATN03_07340 [Corynebacterium pseudotuberculosis]QGX02761.1 hypothetical protein CP316_07460 [Corynebacterium pseudotuberculosis 316]AMN73653.1 hypothetical protein ATN04_04310 [Corynebacterium pseudotuberculosis]AMN76186.1 hypothetical protein ATN05_07820 [Corynebacterium pseudotuberculosis]ANZ92305.1 hypothetical protein CPMB20_07835 [Corynebacterium pseudotuberculosis]